MVLYFLHIEGNILTRLCVDSFKMASIGLRICCSFNGLAHLYLSDSELTFETINAFRYFGWTPWTGDQPIAMPLPTQDNTKIRFTSMPWAGLESTIPGFEWSKTKASTGTGIFYTQLNLLQIKFTRVLREFNAISYKKWFNWSQKTLWRTFKKLSRSLPRYFHPKVTI